MFNPLFTFFTMSMVMRMRGNPRLFGLCLLLPE